MDDPVGLDVERLARALSGWTPPPDSAVFGRYTDPGQQHLAKVAAVIAEYDRLSTIDEDWTNREGQPEFNGSFG